MSFVFCCVLTCFKNIFRSSNGEKAVENDKEKMNTKKSGTDVQQEEDNHLFIFGVLIYVNYRILSSVSLHEICKLRYSHT